MNRRILAFSVAIATLLPVLSHAQTSTSIAVDFDTFAVGDLSGQHNWYLAPTTALGAVETYRVQSGSQAVALGGPAGTNAAALDVNANTSNSLMMQSWMMAPAGITGAMKTRSASYLQLLGTDASGNAVTVNYGVMQAPAPSTDTPVKPRHWAFFVQTFVNGNLVSRAYYLVPAYKVDQIWRSYTLKYDASMHQARFIVDSLVVSTFSLNLANVDTIKLVMDAPRATMDPSSYAYFDGLQFLAQ